MNGDFPVELSMMLRSQRVTSQLFKSLTGWQPRFPSAQEGWPFVVAAARRAAQITPPSVRALTGR